MAKVTISNSKIIGKIKPVNAVNNGPAQKPGMARGNFETFSALDIPYVRNHDASLSEAYGSQHLVDIHCIFPDFSRDADDETAYDFVLTDVYTKNILDTGSEVFYRLGSSIEHWARKYGTLVPPDFEKWAKICEHIILHYNHGWADGFHYGIKYWEIWNEADLDEDDAEDKRTWGGTKKEFFDFYCTASKYLKNRFPELKIGGPAVACREDWAKDLLVEMRAKNIETDFFSWHNYAATPEDIMAKARRMKKILNETGYGDVESILNEWNYVRNWEDTLGYIRVIKVVKGAAFNAAVMCAAQNCDAVDMLMYYDARAEKVWNGLFSSDTMLPIKGYYSFKILGEIYKLQNQTLCESDDENIYVLGASSGGESTSVITYYTDDDAAISKEVEIDIDEDAEMYLLDEEHDLEKVGELKKGTTTITMAPNTVIRLRTK